MVDTVIAREIISNQARAAALCFVNTNVKPAPFYPEGSAAQLAFEASFNRWLLALTAPEGVEGSA